MPLAVDCPACKGSMLFEPSLYGQAIHCPACGHRFTVEPPDDGTFTDRPTEPPWTDLTAGEPPPIRRVKQPLQPKGKWRSVRLGFDLVLCGSVLLTGVLVWMAILGRQGQPSLEKIEQLLYLQGAALVLLVLILVGQIQLTGVPARCGRGACILSLLANIGILGLTATQMYVAVQLLSAD